MKNYNFNKGKKCLLVALSSLCALNLISCSIPTRDVDNSLTSKTETVFVTETTETESSLLSSISDSSSFSSTDNSTTESISNTETETHELSESTKYVDGIGYILDDDPQYISNDEFVNIREQLYNYGFISLGYGNPALLEYMKSYLRNENITLKDVGYFQPDSLNDSNNDIIDVTTQYNTLRDHGFYTDIVRYVMAANNLRMWIDEIPFEFFQKYFPDYIERYLKGERFDFEYSYNSIQDVSDLIYECSSKGESALREFLAKCTPEQYEYVRYYIFDTLLQYNFARFEFSATYSTLISFMPIAEDVDGKYVLAPSSATLDKFQRQINLLPKCETLDITNPETYDDIVNSGINVDLIERTFEYAGLDIPKLSEQHDQSSDQPRSRG